VEIYCAPHWFSLWELAWARSRILACGFFIENIVDICEILWNKTSYIQEVYREKQTYTYKQPTRKYAHVFILRFSIQFDKCLHYIHNIKPIRKIGLHYMWNPLSLPMRKSLNMFSSIVYYGVLTRGPQSWASKIFEPNNSVTKGHFTPRGRAKPPWGRLHEISTLFGLEVGLNYTL
jgi:hypothetical protein